MMKNQTAVEYLHNRIKDKSVLMQNSEGYYICIRVGALEEIINQAKQMEREQIIKACDFGRAYGYNQATGYPNHIHNPEQYYNETYLK
jgi:hypothetical protein